MGNAILDFLFRPFNFIKQWLWRLNRKIFNRPKRDDQEFPLVLAEPEQSHMNLIEQAEAEVAMSDEDQRLFDHYNQTVTEHAGKPNINAISLEQMAYAYTHLVHLLSKHNNSDYKKCLNSAMNIYDTAPEKYHQEKLTLLNNVALNLQSHKKYAEAVQLYQLAIPIAQIYFPKADNRTLILQNNLACAYISSGQKQKGQNLLRKCQAIASKQEQENEVKGLILSNMGYLNVQANRIVEQQVRVDGELIL